MPIPDDYQPASNRCSSAPVVDQESDSRKPGSRQARQVVGMVLLVGLMVLLGYFGRSYFPAIEQWVDGLGWIGPVVFSVVYLVLVSCCFPVSVLGISAGSLFGFGWGALLLLVNGLVTGCVIFGLARRFGQRRVTDFLATRPRLAAIESLARSQSFRLMILLRLSPFNYGVVCYFLGSSRVRFFPYLIGLLAILPSALAQSYFGYAALRLGRAAGQDGGVSRIQEVWTGIGLVACLILVAVLGNLTRQALLNTTDRNERIDPGDTSD